MGMASYLVSQLYAKIANIVSQVCFTSKVSLVASMISPRIRAAATSPTSSKIFSI